MQRCTKLETLFLGPCNAARSWKRCFSDHATLHEAGNNVSWAMQRCTKLETLFLGSCNAARSWKHCFWHKTEYKKDKIENR